MTNNDKDKQDIIDDDLYEEFDDEELYELVERARQDVLEKAKKRDDRKPKTRFPKWLFWLVAFAMLFNVLALFPQTLSIPVIEFLKTSAKLSADDDIQNYKKSIVVVETSDSRGTGFSIDSQGHIMTNNHVVEDEDRVLVAFKDKGLFNAEVVERYPDIDLAVLETETSEALPYLKLAQSADYIKNEPIYFIGNPLKFNRIANEGNVIDYIQLKDWNKQVLMIEAPVYRGNSGSPVINMDNEVIGVVFATTHHDTFGKVGLFVPIDYYYEAKTES